MRTAMLILGMWAPVAAAQPLQSGLRVWLDADEADTVVTDPTGTETVALWRNRIEGTGPLTNAVKAAQPEYVRGGLGGRSFITFDGSDDVLRSVEFSSAPLVEATIFIVAAPRSNDGDYGAFFTCNASGENDYLTGINVDLGQGGTAAFSFLNVEGPKRITPGGINFRTRTDPFGTWHVIQVNYWSTRMELIVDGVREARTTQTGPAQLLAEEFRVGGRWYGGIERGFGHVSIAEILVYESSADCGSLDQTGIYLAEKYGIATAYPPRRCVNDFNADCFVDFFDYDEFVLAFEAGRIDADVNADGFLDFFDYDDFVRAFEEGC